MPALITHCLFAEMAAPLALREIGSVIVPLDEDGASSAAEGQRSEERLAFLLGSQGPDPLFFSITSLRGPAARSLGRRMHREHMSTSLGRMREAADQLASERDRRLGQAFAAGQLAHYLLDRTAHPFIYAQQFELCADPALSGAGHEVHAVIESDIDAGMLHLVHGTTVAETSPTFALASTPRIERVAGLLVAAAGTGAFSIHLGGGDYGRALSDMRLAYRLIEPQESRRASVLLPRLERLVRPHSMLASLAHRTDLDECCASMNPRGRAWTDPFTGSLSHDRFVDRFSQALCTFDDVIGAYLAGEDTELITRGLDYSGRKLGPDEKAADPSHASAILGHRI